MKFSYTSKLRRGALALVVAMTAGAGVAAFAQPAPGGHGPGGPGGPDRGGWNQRHDGPGDGGMMMGGRGLQRMLDEVDATTAQRGQIKEIFRSAQADIRAQRQAGDGLREKGLQLFAQPTVDAAAAEGLRQQMLAERDQSSKRMLQAMLDASKVLTPEQRAKAYDIVATRQAKMHERMQQRRPASAPAAK